MLTPAHPRPPLQDINDAFERAMVMRARLGIGMDMDRAGPDLLRPDPGEIDRSRAVHAGGLRRVGIELIARDHLDAVGLPVDPFWLVPLSHMPVPKNSSAVRQVYRRVGPIKRTTEESVLVARRGPAGVRSGPPIRATVVLGFRGF